MKVGRTLSVVASLTALAGGVVPWVFLAEGASLGQAFLYGGAPAVATLLAALPLGLGLDRELRRLGAETIEACEDRGTPQIATRGMLGSLRGSIQEGMNALHQRLKGAEARLKEAEIREHVTECEREQAEAVLDSLRDAVLVTDSFNELAMANGEAARLLGFELEEAMHSSIDRIVGDEKLRSLIRESRGLGTPSHRKQFDYVLQPTGPGAEPRYFDVTMTSLPNGSGAQNGVLTILRDVTREREISQMKTDFVSKVSHELRTPLSSVNAYIELLLDGEAQDEAARQEFYQIIKNEADRLNRLIDNMLNISRIEAGIVKVDRCEVDFLKSAEQAVEVITPQAKLKDIMVTLKKSPLACTAMADSDMIQQIMLNLLSNAVKYTPEGGRVTMTVENDDATGSVMVTVADTGLGIPPDALPRVFDKFYRIENYKRVAKGTGLGLALVKHLVETVHHGQISVTSELGMGSKFIFTIPYDIEAG
ncbi:MAG: ATP-binding protein [Planctomycetota bacterium]|nr:ATP-binding protein [Planctomycetota bacterium]